MPEVPLLNPILLARNQKAPVETTFLALFTRLDSSGNEIPGHLQECPGPRKTINNLTGIKGW
jgi:hypothetical protein